MLNLDKNKHFLAIPKAVLLAACTLFLAACGGAPGDADTQSGSYLSSGSASSGQSSSSSSSGSFTSAGVDGQELYQDKCAACHGEQGQGQVSRPFSDDTLTDLLSLSMLDMAWRLDESFSLFSDNHRFGQAGTCGMQCVVAIAEYMKHWDSAPELNTPSETPNIGEVRYFEHCASCHGAKGEGMPVPIHPAKYSFDYLTTLIEAKTPMLNQAECEDDCARAVATYIQDWTPPTVDGLLISVLSDVADYPYVEEGCFVCHGRRGEGGWLIDHPIEHWMDIYAFEDLVQLVEYAPGQAAHQCFGECAARAVANMWNWKNIVRPSVWFTLSNKPDAPPVEAGWPANERIIPVIDGEGDEGLVEFPTNGLEGYRIHLRFVTHDWGYNSDDQLAGTSGNSFELYYYRADGLAELSDKGRGTLLAKPTNLTHDGATTFSIDVTDQVLELNSLGATHIGFRFANPEPADVLAFWNMEFILTPATE